MDEQGVVVRFQARARMSFLQSVKTRSGAHLATCVAYRSPSSVVEVWNEWRYISAVRLYDLQRDNL